MCWRASGILACLERHADATRHLAMAREQAVGRAAGWPALIDATEGLYGRPTPAPVIEPDIATGWATGQILTDLAARQAREPAVLTGAFLP